MVALSSNKRGGYTADYGNTLEVNEIDGYYNFDINVLSIEKIILLVVIFMMEIAMLLGSQYQKQ